MRLPLSAINGRRASTMRFLFSVRVTTVCCSSAFCRQGLEIEECLSLRAFKPFLRGGDFGSVYSRPYVTQQDWEEY